MAKALERALEQARAVRDETPGWEGPFTLAIEALLTARGRLDALADRVGAFQSFEAEDETLRRESAERREREGGTGR